MYIYFASDDGVKMRQLRQRQKEKEKLTQDLCYINE